MPDAQVPSGCILGEVVPAVWMPAGQGYAPLPAGMVPCPFRSHLPGASLVVAGHDPLHHLGRHGVAHPRIVAVPAVAVEDREGTALARGGQGRELEIDREVALLALVQGQDLVIVHEAEAGRADIRPHPVVASVAVGMHFVDVHSRNHVAVAPLEPDRNLVRVPDSVLDHDHHTLIAAVAYRIRNLWAVGLGMLVERVIYPWWTKTKPVVPVDRTPSAEAMRSDIPPPVQEGHHQ